MAFLLGGAPAHSGDEPPVWGQQSSSPAPEPGSVWDSPVSAEAPGAPLPDLTPAPQSVPQAVEPVTPSPAPLPSPVRTGRWAGGKRTWGTPPLTGPAPGGTPSNPSPRSLREELPRGPILAREPGPQVYPRGFSQPNLAEDGNGRLWLSDEGRLYRYDSGVDGWQLADDGWRSQGGSERLVRLGGDRAYGIALLAGEEVGESPQLEIREMRLASVDDGQVTEGKLRRASAWRVASEARVQLPDGEFLIRDAEIGPPVAGEDGALWLVVGDREDRGRLVRIPLVGGEVGLAVGLRFPGAGASVATVRCYRSLPGSPLLVGTDQGLFSVDTQHPWALPQRVESTATKAITALSPGTRAVGELFAGTASGELIRLQASAAGITAGVVARWPVAANVVSSPMDGGALPGSAAGGVELGTPAIRVVEVDAHGLVWFGPADSRGLSAWIPVLGRVLAVPPIPSGEWVESLFRDGAGRMWGVGVRTGSRNRYIVRFPTDYRELADILGLEDMEVIPLGGDVVVRLPAANGSFRVLVCTGGWCQSAAAGALPESLMQSQGPLPALDRWGNDILVWDARGILKWTRGGGEWKSFYEPYPVGFLPRQPFLRPVRGGAPGQGWVSVQAGGASRRLWSIKAGADGGVSLEAAPRLFCADTVVGDCVIQPVASGSSSFLLVARDSVGQRWVSPVPFASARRHPWLDWLMPPRSSLHPPWDKAPAPLENLGAAAQVLMATSDGGIWFQRGDVIGRAGSQLPGAIFPRAAHGYQVSRAFEDRLGQTWFQVTSPGADVRWVLGPPIVAPTELRLSAPLFSTNPRLETRMSSGHALSRWEARPAEVLYRCEGPAIRSSAPEVTMDVGWRPLSQCSVQTVGVDGWVSNAVNARVFHLSMPHLLFVVAAIGLGWGVALRGRRRERELEGQVVEMKWQMEDLEERIQVMDTRYIIGMPLRDDAMFFGRRHQIAELLLAVRNRAVVTVSGDKRIGKTSLLFKLKRYLETPDVVAQGVDLPVYLSLEQCADGSHFFRQLLNKIAAEVGLSAEDREELGVDRVDGEIAARDVIVELFYGLQDRRRRRVLLLLDEAQRLFHDLGSEGTRIAQGLRHLASEYPDVFGLIIAGVDLMRYGSTQGPNSDLLGIGRILVLGPLDEADARELISKPSRADGVMYEAAAVDLICLYTGCRPLRIQRLCSDIIAGWRRTCAEKRWKPETPVPSSFVQRYFQEQYGGQGTRLDAA